MSRNLYIVPYDFTPVTDKAVDYALHIGKYVDTEIRILHLAANEAKAKFKDKLLEDVRNKLEIPHGVEVTTAVKVGDIFTDIGKIAKEEKAQLVIMGTHGIRGLQNIFGSFAMKVITSTECAFLIVQKNTVFAEISSLALPIDLTKESLQIVNIAGDMANILKANINVLAEKQSDQILNTRLQNRLGIVRNQYKERGIESNIHLVDQGRYAKKIMQFVRKNNIGMVAIAYHSESIFPQFDSFAQKLITNKQAIPVLIINSKLASTLYY